MQITTLGSGSKGNSLFLKSGDTRVLIDCGLSLEDFLCRMDGLFENPRSLSAIVITHTHGDHVRAVRRVSDRFSVPVYASEKSFTQPSLKKVKKKSKFEMEQPFQVGEFEFLPIPLSHDCDPTVAFRVEARGKRFGIATDLGTPTDNLRRDLKDCGALLLEFNHDLRMLETGPYPWSLKQRVSSSLGHLSNEQASDLLQSLLHGELKHLTLGHLSETNNRPEIAMEKAQRVVRGEGLNKTVICIAPQHQTGETVTI